MSIRMSVIAATAVASLLLTGCNDDTKSEVSVVQPGTSDGSFGPIVQNGIVVDNGFVEDDSVEVVLPGELDFGKGFVANKDVKVFSDFSRFNFSQVRVLNGSDVLLLNNEAYSSAYSGFGVKLDNSIIEPPQSNEYSRLESQSADFITQMKAGIEKQYVGAKINTLVFERTRNPRSAVLRVALDVNINKQAVTSSNLLRLNILANTLNGGYQPYFYPFTDYASDGDMKVDLVFWQDSKSVYAWVSTYPQKYSDEVNSKYIDFITGDALASANPAPAR